MMRMMLTFLFVSAVAWAEVPPEPAVSDFEPVEVFLSANESYQDDAFAAAVEGYQALVDEGVAGAQVHYNLGNAWLRAGRLGEAIASYRKAEQLAPRDADVAANLAFARKNVTDALEPPGPSDIARTALFWHYALGPAERWTALVVLNLLLWGVMALRLRRRESEWLGWAVWALAVPWAALAGSAVVHEVWPDRVAVVIVEEAEVRAGDNDEAVVRFAVHEGTELTVVTERPGWVRVRTSTGQDGWTKAESLRH
jgi:hypothetical protein